MRPGSGPHPEGFPWSIATFILWRHIHTAHERGQILVSALWYQFLEQSPVPKQGSESVSVFVNQPLHIQQKPRHFFRLFCVISQNARVTFYTFRSLVHSFIADFSLLSILQELSSQKDGKRGRLSSTEFINLFKEISTRPEIYFLLVR